MVIKNSVIIKRRFISRGARLFSLLLLLSGIGFTSAVSLHQFYKPLINQYFSGNQTTQEQILSIQSGKYRVSTQQASKDSFSEILSNELGLYKSHSSVGWYADFLELNHPDSFPLVMIYRVDYELGSTEQEFVFSGLFEPKLIARQVRLLP